MNKLKIGNNVKIKRELVTWYAQHLLFCYGIKDEDEPYFKCKIREKDIPEVAMWTNAYTNPNTTLKGKVVGYGSDDDIFKDKRFLKVDIKYKNTKFNVIISEKHLKKI